MVKLHKMPTGMPWKLLSHGKKALQSACKKAVSQRHSWDHPEHPHEVLWGKRMAFLKQLCNGLLLGTRPLVLNRFSLSITCQKFAIVTSEESCSQQG